MTEPAMGCLPGRSGVLRTGMWRPNSYQYVSADG